MNYLGLDCSSKTIHAILLSPSGVILKQLSWGASEKDMDARFLSLVRAFMQELPAAGTDLVGIVESAIYLQNVKVTVGIAQVIAGVKLSMNLRGLRCFAVDPMSWKKVVLSDGKAAKEKILAFAETRWGKVFEKQDYADAACIALYGVKMFEEVK